MRNSRPLSAALAKKAANELNENPDELKYYLDAVRDWLSLQPHLKPRTEDQFLITFLRGSKFSLEKCKQKIDSFYTFRDLYPDMFRNRDVDDPKVNEILRLGTLLHLPHPIAEDGPRVLMIRIGTADLKKYTMLDFIRVATMMAEICLFEDYNAIICGYIVVMDLTDVTPFHILKFDPLLAKRVIDISNKCIPSRMKGFHIINMAPTFELCFNMIKSAIHAKLKNRIHFHGTDLNTLYEHIPKHCLPVEYGGKCDTIQDILGIWETKFRKNKEYFIEEENYGCDEKLREGKSMTQESMFGIDGTFRKLNVD